MPTASERESKSLVARISDEQSPIPVFMLHYQFKSSYSVLYRIGAGMIGVVEVLPAVRFTIGYVY